MRTIFYWNTMSSKGSRATLGWVFLIVSCIIASSAARADKPAPAGTKAKASAQKVDFNRDIVPIFRAACIACHGADKPQGSLRLDSEAGVLQGGASGQVVIAGNSSDSILVQRLLGLGDAPRMPQGDDPLSRTQIDNIRAWIDQGSFSASGAQVTLEVAANPPKETTKAIGSPRLSESGEITAKISALFAQRCVQCHGEFVQQNELRLDSLAAALKGSASGNVIVPGNSEKSPLVRRMLGLDRPQMPYKSPPLSPEQTALVRHWIDAGAPGADSVEAITEAKPAKHWAYVKPVRPEVPKVKNPAWCRNPIDYFVLARLEKEEMLPAPEVGKETLIRRVSLDLIGLPPTIEEVEAFLADNSPNAYEKVVDRLLASPHYGERWARSWLDLARYADTHGYEEDRRRTAWKFRDWVMQALNQNMSFKQFTIEQLAGDMLPNVTTAQKIATGFHRNTMLNKEGGIDHEEYRWYSLVDRVNTTADVWLATTLACAQCHNHKFDPFPQKDYYRFLAFFDNSEYSIFKPGPAEGWVDEPEIELPTPEQEAKSKEIKAEMAKLQTVLDTPTPELQVAQAGWEAEMKNLDSNWITLRLNRYLSAGGATLTLREDQSLLVGGKNPEADTYIIEARTDRTGITAVRLEVLSDPSLPQGGPGRDPEGNFFLSDVEVEAAPAGKPEPVQKIVFKEAVADESQAGYRAENLVSKDTRRTGWAIDVSQADAVPRRQLVLIPEKPFGFEPGTLMTVRLKHEMRRASRNIGRFRLSVTSIATPKRAVELPARLRPVLDLPIAQRSLEQMNALATVYRSVSVLLQPARDRLGELKKSFDKLGIVTAMVLQERNSFERPSTDLRVRGSFLSKGEKVYAGVPSVLNRLTEDQMPNRLGLARWLVSEDNPLTARVTVNRDWEAFFGRGLVETSEDFGAQGQRPTHPALLDWLATEFMGQSWDMKAIKRLIVTSATYQQSSRVAPGLEARDPYNRWLARGPRFRVEAEMVRDITLAASGLLSRKMGGPSVFPYQPEGVWDRPYSDDKWVMSEGEDRYRRGLYTFVRRTAAYPSLVNFDAPSREFCTVRRPRTNTPLQALTTLNDPAFFEAAKALAKRMMKEAGPDPSSRAIYGFRLCVSRHPNKEELGRLLDYYKQELVGVQSDAEVARAGVQSEKSTPDPPELAAWTMVSNVLLNLDETITKE